MTSTLKGRLLPEQKIDPNDRAGGNVFQKAIDLDPSYAPGIHRRPIVTPLLSLYGALTRTSLSESAGRGGKRA
jgi:hypothetical protein